MDKILYFDISNGAAGDMLLASLADLSDDYENKLSEIFDVLTDKLPGVNTKIKNIIKNSVHAKHIDVFMDSKSYKKEEGCHTHEGHKHCHTHEGHEHCHTHEGHEHCHTHEGHEHCHTHEEHEHCHTHEGHEHCHTHEGHKHCHTHEGHEHCHTHEGHEHCHTHEGHEHCHTHEGHEHRNLKDITDLINSYDISQKSKKDAINVFSIIAAAEAKAHKLNIDEVHFHEVGAYDSIIDIVSFCTMIDYIKPVKIVSTDFPIGTGSIDCAHGIMPNPAPATAEITKGFPTYTTNIKGELITPTAAAILTYFAKFGKKVSGINIATGAGAGNKNYEGSGNICRVMLLKTDNEYKNEDDEKSEHCVIEANIDDMTGEALSYALEKIMSNGASDAWFSPIVMKKSRPAYSLHILSKKNKKDILIDTVFNETTTLGVRVLPIEKRFLEREVIIRETIYGKVRFKKRVTPNNRTHYKAEYDDISKIAKEKNLSIDEITRILYKSIEE